MEIALYGFMFLCSLYLTRCTPAIVSSNSDTPTVTGVVPSHGKVGDIVVIGGFNFPTPARAFFGTVAPSFQFQRGSSIDTPVPDPGVATRPLVVPVTVKNPLGGPVSNAVQFTYDGPISLSPTSGVTSGGTVVIITGSGGTDFTGATSVNFGTVVIPPSGFTIDSPTQITVTSPAAVFGAVGVTVSVPTGTTLPAVFTYVTEPVITGMAPQTDSGMRTVPFTIIGSGFTGGLNVSSVTFSFDMTVLTATNLQVINDITITGTTPNPGAVTYPIQASVRVVKTADIVSNDVSFTYE